MLTLKRLERAQRFMSEDRLLLQDMDASCKEVARLLREKLDRALDGMAGQPDTESDCVAGHRGGRVPGRGQQVAGSPG
jgi:hypothetical protein